MSTTVDRMGCRRFTPDGPACSAVCKYHLCDGDLGGTIDEAAAKVDAIVQTIITERPPLAEIVRQVEAIAMVTWSETRWSIYDALDGAGVADWEDLYQTWLEG